MSLPAASTRPPSWAELPPLFATDVLPAIRVELASSSSTLVVLDDDPTGTQTVCDVPVVTQWDVPTLAAELTGASVCFYILTNSRSLPPPEARALATELALNLRLAAQQTAEARFPGIDYVVFPGNVGGQHALADAVRALSLS